MNVTLVNPPSPGIESYNIGIRVPPLGLAYLASILEREGHEVRIIDASVLKLSISQIKSLFKRSRPDIIGVTSTTPTIYEAYSVIKAGKDVCPDSFTILGGPHASSLPVETLKECPALDAVCIGEGEETIVDLAEALGSRRGLSTVKGIAYRSRGKVRINQPRPLIRDLDSIPFPARHLLPMSKYSVLGKKTVVCHIMSSRGCPFQCIFCSSSRFFGRQYRARTAENVVDEMEYLVSEYNPESIEFSDDEFTLNRKRVEEICDEIKRRGIDVQWACSSRVDTINKRLLQKMRRAGCFLIYYGIESASQRILNFIKKGIRIDQVVKAIKQTREAGIKVLGSFMIGFPDETRGEIEETIKFSKRLNIDYAQFSIVTPYPGTELYEIAKREGLLLTTNWSEYTAARPVMKTRNINVEELPKIFRKAYMKFYFSPKMLLRNLNRYIPQVLGLTLKSTLKRTLKL